MRIQLKNSDGEILNEKYSTSEFTFLSSKFKIDMNPASNARMDYLILHSAQVNKYCRYIYSFLIFSLYFHRGVCDVSSW